MKTRRKLITLLSMWGITAMAWTVARSAPTLPTTFREGNAAYPAYYLLDWMDEKLTGNDKPYQLIRAQIDKAVSAKALTGQTLAGYKATYNKKPKDPRNFFRWAYALSIIPGNPRWKEQVTHLTTDHFWRIPSPRTYQYARLRWLSQAVAGPFRGADSETIRTFGERLLQRNPNDYFVLYSLVDYSPNEQALKYAQRMVRLQPRKQSAVATLAFAQFRQFLRTHTQRDADSAVAAHQKLLQMLPPTDRHGRQDVLKTIGHIRKVRARWANKVG